MTQILLVLYFLGSVAIAVPLLSSLGHAGNLAGTTSGKILAAALIAMGIGALGAARDPWRQRLMIQVADRVRGAVGFGNRLPARGRGASQQ